MNKNKYKPTTLEENYSNIVYIKKFFLDQVNSYIWQYHNIISIYNNPYKYYQLFYAGMINPYLNSFEAEIRNLAYNILGFTVSVFEIIAYALDCWCINSTGIKRNITTHEYDKSINLLNKKKLIKKNDIGVLLDFRKQRNGYVHYGRLNFCKYIFDNRFYIDNLLQSVEDLLSNMNMDLKRYEAFSDEQEDYFIEMQKTLSCYINEIC